MVCGLHLLVYHSNFYPLLPFLFWNLILLLFLSEDLCNCMRPTQVIQGNLFILRAYILPIIPSSSMSFLKDKLFILFTEIPSLHDDFSFILFPKHWVFRSLVCIGWIMTLLRCVIIWKKSKRVQTSLFSHTEVRSWTHESRCSVWILAVLFTSCMYFVKIFNFPLSLQLLLYYVSVYPYTYRRLKLRNTTHKAKYGHMGLEELHY
jgi:hypothetical protein